MKPELRFRPSPPAWDASTFYTWCVEIKNRTDWVEIFRGGSDRKLIEQIVDCFNESAP